MKAVVAAFNQEMALVWAFADQSSAALVTVPLNYCCHIVAGRCAECEQCAASCSGSGHGARLPSVSAISILHHHLLDRCSPFNTSLNISLSILHHDVLVPSPQSYRDNVLVPGTICDESGCGVTTGQCLHIAGP